jgi:hypothetical protein
MMIVKTIAILAALGFSFNLALPQTAQAQYKPGVSGKKRSVGTTAPRRYSYRGGVGGYQNGDDYTPYVVHNGPYGNTPSFDNRNFWERVQTDRFQNPGTANW